MGLPIYRDIEGELHPKSETSVHHVIARSLTKGPKARKFINQYVLTPRMLDRFHNVGDEALHNNVPLLAPPSTFVMHCLQQVINDLDSVGQYNQLIEFVGRIDQWSTQHNNSVVRKECGRLAEGMQMQMPYILLGQVEVVQYEGSGIINPARDISSNQPSQLDSLRS